MWGIAVGAFTLSLLASLFAEQLREKERDPKTRRWNAERDPYFNRDYARPNKKRTESSVAA